MTSTTTDIITPIVTPITPTTSTASPSRVVMTTSMTPSVYNPTVGTDVKTPLVYKPTSVKQQVCYDESCAHVDALDSGNTNQDAGVQRKRYYASSSMYRKDLKVD